jgi:hypothetical protein
LKTLRSQGWYSWVKSFFVAPPTFQDERTAIQRAMKLFPAKDLPTPEKMKEAIDKSFIDITDLHPPDSSECDLLSNPGTTLPRIITS